MSIPGILVIKNKNIAIGQNLCTESNKTPQETLSFALAHENGVKNRQAELKGSKDQFKSKP